MDHKLERERIEQANHGLAVELMRPRRPDTIHNRSALLNATRRRWPSMSEGRVGQVVSIALLMRPLDPDREHKSGLKGPRSQLTAQGKPATVLRMAPAPSSLVEQVKLRLQQQLRVNSTGLHYALEVFAYGLVGERYVAEVAINLGISRRELGRRLARGKLASAQHWLMAARVVWGIYTVCVTGCTFKELSRRTQVEQTGFSGLCKHATGLRPTELRDLCHLDGSITPIVDRLAAGYLLNTQGKREHAP